MNAKVSQRQLIRKLRQLAEHVLQRYGMSGAKLTSLKDCKQLSFKVKQSSAGFPPNDSYKEGTFLLRMHAAEDRGSSMIRSELQWLRAILNETRIVVPEPVVNVEGDLVTEASLGEDLFHCALTRWVEGRFYLRRNGPGPRALHQVGRMMAELHLHGQRFKRPPGFQCHRWDWEGVFGNSSPYFPIVENRFLSLPDRRLFSAVARRLRQVMAELGTGSEVFGLVHADLIQINYLFHRGEARAIDFGDLGYAHYLYDMGVTLFALWGRDDDGRQRHAFLDGYREVRPLSAEHETFLDLFIAGRGVALARCVMGTDEPIEGIGMGYVEKVLEGIRHWVREH